MKSLTDFKFEVDSSNIRSKLREARVMSEKDSLDHLHLFDYTNTDQRIKFQKNTSHLIPQLPSSSQPGPLSLFVSEYNLESDEGLSLMTLVEAFLRVPDNKTRDKLFLSLIHI